MAGIVSFGCTKTIYQDALVTRPASNYHTHTQRTFWLGARFRCRVFILCLYLPDVSVENTSTTSRNLRRTFRTGIGIGYRRNSPCQKFVAVNMTLEGTHARGWDLWV